MAKERRNGNHADRHEFLFSDGGNATDRMAGNGGDVLFGFHGHENDLYGRDGDSPAVKLYPVSPGSPPQLASSSSSSSSSGAIEHPVSKFDTLAGVAIRYGVEVADIRRLNGLTTDIQMFALKSLLIPLPGRHPPSTYLSNGSDTPGLSEDPDLSAIILHFGLMVAWYFQTVFTEGTQYIIFHKPLMLNAT